MSKCDSTTYRKGHIQNRTVTNYKIIYDFDLSVILKKYSSANYYSVAIQLPHKNYHPLQLHSLVCEGLHGLTEQVDP